jgi:hypothetical protein
VCVHVQDVSEHGEEGHQKALKFAGQVSESACCQTLYRHLKVLILCFCTSAKGHVHMGDVGEHGEVQH